MLKTKNKYPYKIKLKNLKELKQIENLDKVKLFILEENKKIKIYSLEDIRNHVSIINKYNLDYAVYPKITKDEIVFRCLPLPESA